MNLLPLELLDQIILYYGKCLSSLLHLRTINKVWKECVHRSRIWLDGDLTFYCPKEYFLNNCIEYRLYHSNLVVSAFHQIYQSIHTQSPVQIYSPFHRIIPFSRNIVYSKVFAVQLVPYSLSSLKMKLRQYQSSQMNSLQDRRTLSPADDPENPIIGNEAVLMTEQKICTTLSEWYLNKVYRRYHELWQEHIQWYPSLQRYKSFYLHHFRKLRWTLILYPKIALLTCLYLFLPLELFHVSSISCSSNVIILQLEGGFLLLYGVIILYMIVLVGKQLEKLLLCFENITSLTIYFHSLYIIYCKVIISFCIGIFFSLILINTKIIQQCLSMSHSSLPWVSSTLPLWIFISIGNYYAQSFEKRSISRMIFVLSYSICIGLTLVCSYYDGIYIISSIGLASIPLYPTCIAIIFIALIKAWSFFNRWIFLCAPSDSPLLQQYLHNDDHHDQANNRRCSCNTSSFMRFVVDLYEVICSLLMLVTTALVMVEGFFGQKAVMSIHCSPVLLGILFFYGLHGTVTTSAMKKEL